MIPKGATFISMIRLWALATILGLQINQISQIIMKGMNVNEQSSNMDKELKGIQSDKLGETLSEGFVWQLTSIGIIMSIIWLFSN